VYSGPQQMGPANPLWSEPTGYAATMVGFPYDDLQSWRSVYPAEVFIEQFKKVADGFEQALDALKRDTAALDVAPQARVALEEEMLVADACAIHFRSVENQSRFVVARDALLAADANADTVALTGILRQIVRNEKDLALRLHRLRMRDSRLGFEASNHYFYVPMDLAAKVVNCEEMLSGWLQE